MIFDTDVMIWAFRGNGKALDAIDEATTRSISSVTYMELLQGVRNKTEMLSMKRFLSTLGFATLPVTAEISTRAISIMESSALKSDLGVCDALIFATALENGDTLLSGNAKHFKEVPLLDAMTFRA
ncbi:MAG: type II toxin-antitoxin system VapC family toxin [Kiritimatiellae bacterium]|nr:type II toxin-antitoxin system VapC family toxin [Kiritimatiellia bacterium]